ncbi:MAG: hypothetical protein ACKOSO_07840, partial [Actinomycetota bacterium]
MLGTELRVEVLEHAEAGVERLRHVQVVPVAPLPGERGAARDDLDAARVDAALGEHGLAVEVVADHADHADVGAEARGAGEVDRGGDRGPLTGPEWRRVRGVGVGASGG